MSAPFRRVVTGHKDGKSNVLLDDKLELNPGFASNAVTLWLNHQYPAELADCDAAAEGGVKISTKGSLIRVVDFPPNSQGHNHRTRTLDYGIIMDGEIELVLEDGSKTVVRAGEVVVQQATMHQWNNNTDKACRVIFVLFPSKAATGPDGEELGDAGVPKKFQMDD
ncbi:uncharacterized protein N0V89_006457 [Didymosphaeria variabile]|uniref:Cupin type-2 domain-containing protein n=1 Tax=Didymosphaeria variabile TaxID=1932322 RepID=A0A9W8XH36_9PLEO|nr:uncharacterized protein N0V89_006457 [Didymosphaeria variabile]KAJ4351118.1 hypothetical protein N0V89_006457 [Didymosphaeria variabile]